MKIKKTFQGQLPDNKILNTESTSQTDTYSCDYINNLNTYSTEEQVIGTWINGKPLYRKILQYSLSSGNATDKFNISELSIATTTKLEGIALNNGYARQVGYVYGNATTTLGEMAGMYLSTNFTILNVTHAGTSLGTLYVTIEYTKTTD